MAGNAAKADDGPGTLSRGADWIKNNPKKSGAAALSVPALIALRKMMASGKAPMTKGMSNGQIAALLGGAGLAGGATVAALN